MDEKVGTIQNWPSFPGFFSRETSYGIMDGIVIILKTLHELYQDIFYVMASMDKLFSILNTEELCQGLARMHVDTSTLKTVMELYHIYWKVKARHDKKCKNQNSKRQDDKRSLRKLLKKNRRDASNPGISYEAKRLYSLINSFKNYYFGSFIQFKDESRFKANYYKTAEAVESFSRYVSDVTYYVSEYSQIASRSTLLGSNSIQWQNFAYNPQKPITFVIQMTGNAGNVTEYLMDESILLYMIRASRLKANCYKAVLVESFIRYVMSECLTDEISHQHLPQEITDDVESGYGTLESSDEMDREDQDYIFKHQDNIIKENYMKISRFKYQVFNCLKIIIKEIQLKILWLNHNRLDCQDSIVKETNTKIRWLNHKILDLIHEKISGHFSISWSAIWSTRAIVSKLLDVTAGVESATSLLAAVRSICHYVPPLYRRMYELLSQERVETYKRNKSGRPRAAHPSQSSSDEGESFFRSMIKTGIFFFHKFW